MLAMKAACSAQAVGPEGTAAAAGAAGAGVGAAAGAGVGAGSVEGCGAGAGALLHATAKTTATSASGRQRERRSREGDVRMDGSSMKSRLGPAYRPASITRSPSLHVGYVRLKWLAS